ncbi:MAG TPA: ATP-binding protein [Roseiflexaceae bacterium]|nr:ATP-binding protein [Roseiflexaceae bacterium]
MSSNGASPLPTQPQDLLYDVLDNLPAAVLIVALPDFRILTINARACMRLAVRISADLVGRPCAEVIPRFAEDNLAEVWLSAAGIQPDGQGTLVASGSALLRRWQVVRLGGPGGERLLVYRIENPAETLVRPEQQFASSTHQIAQALISTLDRDQLLDLILEHLRSVVSYDSAAIMLRDERGYYVAAGRGFEDRAALLRLRFTPEDPLVREVTEASDAIILRDAQVEVPLKAPVGPIRGWMGVPLRAHGETVGILTIDSFAPNRYTMADAARAQAFAAYAALAVRNAELFGQAQERAARLEQALADLRVAQQRLVQSERLSAVGELVAGVAHELNNPLTAVLGFATILQQTAPADMQADIAPIVEGANRARRIVQNLLTFARQREAHLEEVDLNQAVRHVLGLYGYLLRSDGVRVEERLTPGLPTTLADMTAIQQVLLNLINNARQALSGWSGERTITISTRVLPADGGAGRLAVEVADSGPGIAPEHLPLVFEPFFTTKPVGEGTGLGLSICYGIVTQYGGEIRAASRPGEGARFTVELPVRSGEGQLLAPSAQPAVQPGHAARILVIDDEPPVGALIERLLGGRGYHTRVCLSAAEALALLERDCYDVVISDIKMPGLGGAQVYEELARRRPQMTRRLLFISGDTISHSTREFLDAAGCAFLEKPFDVQELVATVQRLLQIPVE